VEQETDDEIDDETDDDDDDEDDETYMPLKKRKSLEVEELLSGQSGRKVFKFFSAL